MQQSVVMPGFTEAFYFLSSFSLWRVIRKVSQYYQSIAEHCLKMEEKADSFSLQIQGLSTKHLNYPLWFPLFFSSQVSGAISRAPDYKLITLDGIIFCNLGDLLHPCKGYFTPLQRRNEVPGSES